MLNVNKERYTNINNITGLTRTTKEDDRGG
jgi:hypothetical protein